MRQHTTQQMSQLLEWSCNLAGESQLFYWLGSAWLSGTKPTAQLSLKKKLGWLRWLNSWLTPAPGVSATLLPACDSWVNSKDLHAPELLADFESQPNSIRTLGISDNTLYPQLPCLQSTMNSLAQDSPLLLSLPWAPAMSLFSSECTPTISVAAALAKSWLKAELGPTTTLA